MAREKSAPEPDTFVRQSEAVERFPGVTPYLLRRWASVGCPQLGKAIGTGECAGVPTYSVRDLTAAMAARHVGPLPDEFTDDEGTWVWEAAVADGTAGTHPFARRTLHQWRDGGCPAFKGQKLATRMKWGGAGPAGGREYVRREDLAKIEAAMTAGDPPPPVGFVSRADALARFSKEFLERYGKGADGRRQQPAEAHPLLGRPVRTHRRKLERLGHTAADVWYSAADLDSIERGKARPQWLTRDESLAEFMLTAKSLEAAKDRGRVRTQPMPVPPDQNGGRPTAVHYHRPDLEKFRAYLDARAAAPKLGSEDRVFVDAAGRWWPLADAARRVGCRKVDIFSYRQSCPPLGKPLTAKRAKIDLHNSRRGPRHWVHLESDLDLLRERLAGRPDPVVPLPPPVPALVVAFAPGVVVPIAAQEPADKATADMNNGPQFTADWYTDKFNITAARLKEARKAGHLPRSAKPHGRWLYNYEDVRTRWPNEVNDQPL